MKSLILTLIIIFSVHSGLSADETEKPAKDEPVKDEPVKVRLSEKASELPQVETSKTAGPAVEIEVVEKVNIVTTNADGSSPVQPPAAVSNTENKIMPTQPDNNIMIYFILLMVIVIGIMALASIIPPPSSTRTDK